MCSAIVSVLAIVVGGLVPVHAQAATARVVTLAELATKPVDVAISSNQLTLIHFETGDVSMVAIGDPAIVSVTVKGPDVLLKALASLGSTNAFIWQAGRYTQWTLTVRHGTDARLIIVKDSVATPGDESTSKTAEHSPNTAKIATDQAAITPPSGPAVVGTAGGNTAAVPTSTPQLSAPSATQQPASRAIRADDACGNPAMTDQFVTALSARQRELFGIFVTEPTLARLQTLLRELSLPQRCDLLALLAGPAVSEQAAANAPESTGTASGPSLTEAPRTGQAAPPLAQSHRDPKPGAPSGAGGRIQRSVPAAVTLTVTPEIVDGQLFLYYMLENQGQATLLTDILRLRIFDRHGNRVTFRINRTSRDGSIGRLETNRVEYGVIGIDVPEKVLALEWKLITLGSAAEQLVRTEVQVP